MLTKAQEYIYENSLTEVIKSHEKIKLLYDDFHNAMNTIPNNPIGLVFEDGVENKNPNYKIDILTNIIHQIGYWQGIKSNSEKIIYLIKMNDHDFENYLEEKKAIEKANENEMLRIKSLIKSKLKFNSLGEED